MAIAERAQRFSAAGAVRAALAAAVAWLQPLPAAAQPASGDLERAAEAVVALSVEAGDRSAVGAGVVVGRGPDGVLVITAAHVVQGSPEPARRVLARFKRFAKAAPVAATVLQVDRQADLAVLRVEGLRGAGIDPCAVPVARLDAELPVRREHAVYPVGNPAGVPWQVPPAADHVSDVTAREVRFQSGVIEAGHSGGALFNVFGDLVGMVRADEPPYGVALRVAVLARALAAWRIDTGPGPCGAEAAAPGTRTAPAGAGGTTAFKAWLDKLAASRKSFEAGAGYQPSPVLMAIYDNDLPALDRAVAAGARLDGAGGITPLQWAVMLGRKEALRYLLLKGVKLNEYSNALVPGVQASQSDIATGVLQMAARLDDAEAVRLLVKAGAEVDHAAGMSNTAGSPLTVAARYGSVQAARALIAAGADVKLDRYGWGSDVPFPMGAAMESGNIAVAQLLRGAGAPLSSNVGSFADRSRLLAIAAKSGQLESIRWLLAQGVPVECSTAGCDSPLREAVVANQPEAMRALLRAGAKATGSSFEPYLCLAVSMGKVEPLKVLLLAGADPNLAGREGTPLAMARRAENKPMTEALLAHGAKR